MNNNENAIDVLVSTITNTIKKICAKLDYDRTHEGIISSVLDDGYIVKYNGTDIRIKNSNIHTVNELVKFCIPSGNKRKAYIIENGSSSGGTSIDSDSLEEIKSYTKSLVDTSNTEIKKYTDDKVSEHEKYVGTFESETATTVIEYIDEKTSSVETSVTDVVKYTEQSLTDEQKTQARENIDAEKIYVSDVEPEDAPVGSFWIDTSTSSSEEDSEIVFSGSATDVEYDNSESGLNSTNVQDAINELDLKMDTVEAITLTIGTGDGYTYSSGDIRLYKLGRLVIAKSQIIFTNVSVNQNITINTTIPSEYLPTRTSYINGEEIASGVIYGRFRMSFNASGTIILTCVAGGTKEYYGDTCWFTV